MLDITKAAYSVRNSTSHFRGRTLFLALVLSLGLFQGQAQCATGSLNVYSSSTAPTSLLTDFMASATSQWLGTVTASPFFANTYSFTISGKNPNYLPPAPPAISTPTVNAADLLKALVDVSTSTYIYGWADGRDGANLDTMAQLNSYLLNCSSAPYFKASTGTWSVSTCTTTLTTAFKFVYDQYTSTPIAPKGQ